MKAERLLSLDAFRGFTIAAMIVVNNPGSWEHVYSPLLHSKWAGCTPTDLVFPFFLFIVGVSMWFSLKAFDYKLSKKAVIKIIRRSVVIFLIGMFLNAFPFTDFNWHNFRILGVLQRIAIAYGIAAILCLIYDVRNLIITTAVILLGYWLLLLIGSPEGPFSLQSNLPLKFDLAILGSKHLYTGYGIAFEPEGFLSTIPSVATVIIGYLTGRFLSVTQNKESALLQMMLAGVTLIIAGLFLGFFFPIIKALWTSTYVIYTGGLAIIALSFFVYTIDLKGFKKLGKPFIVFGSNPLFIYAFSGILATLLYMIPVCNTSLHEFLYNTVLEPIVGQKPASLISALLLVGICWLVAWGLFKKKIFIKI